MPSLKRDLPINTLASSQIPESIKSCNVCAPPSIMTEFILCLNNLLQIDHPNIGRILDIMEDEKNIYMIQDYYEGIEITPEIIAVLESVSNNLISCVKVRGYLLKSCGLSN